MNKLIIDILPHIEQVANHTTKDYDQRHEIHQALVLKCYENKQKVKALHEKGKLINWFYLVARNIDRDLLRKKAIRAGYSLEYDIPAPKEYKTPLDNVKTLQGMLIELSETERIWITLYLDCDLNISELHRRTNISRRHATERINQILNKWKHLDIYLLP